MKKLLCILLVVMLFVLSGCGNASYVQNDAAEPEEELFNCLLPEWLSWGMTEGEVRQQLNDDSNLRSKDYLKDGIGLYLERTNYDIAGDLYYGHSVEEQYGFSTDNKLRSFYYVIDCYIAGATDKEHNNYFEIFEECKNKLKDTYGEPDKESEQWVDEYYKNDEHMFSKAVYDGDYIAEANWYLEGYICSIELNRGVKIKYYTVD